MSESDHDHLDPAAQALLAEILDLARATSEARAERGDLEPFALVRAAGQEEQLILLGDVAQHLGDASGTGRIATTLIGRYDAEVFAISAQATASPDGSPAHPQAREVVRVIVGHRGGASGATWCELRRTADGPRLTGMWETAE